ncbi:MAG: 50S ribosomal protein L20 [Candidatus Auribacterota bacterium]|nr:50S ribosomal protein L20 [Candidatus Auribacterota bacterium]
MTRVKTAPAGHRRRKKIRKLAKGYRGGRSKLHRTAREAVMRAQAEAYRGRKLRKRDFRALWITRIRAAAIQEGISYSRFIGALGKAGIAINRKILAELAVHHPDVFSSVVKAAQGKES